MEQIGLVKSISGGRAEIEVTRISGCGENCGSCSGCDTGHSLILKNNINAQVGDKVLITGKAKDIFKYTFLVYIFPLALLILGIAGGTAVFKPMGMANYELLSFGIGLLLMALAYFVVRLVDNRIEKEDKDTIVMTEILD